MIAARPGLACLLAVSGCAPASIEIETRPSAAGDPATIRWDVGPGGEIGPSVVDFDPGWYPPAVEADAWTRAFVLRVDDGRAGPDADRPVVPGSIRFDGGAARFVPRYPLDRGVTYRANFRPSLLPGGSGGEVRSAFRRPAHLGPPTVVAGLDPVADVLPENLLRFYLHTSAPMSRRAYEHVRLLRDDETPVDLPFLELGEELWDRSGTRLTLLIDPGRIKRGLRPREESGPVLESGRSYAIVVDPAWPDAEGRPLAAGFRRAFRVGPSDEARPDPQSWAISAPTSGSTDPLDVRFPEPIDRAQLAHAIGVVGPDGVPLAGSSAVAADGRSWRFRPDLPWLAGDHRLDIDADLEDLAGNSIRRLFEVDATRPPDATPEERVATRPFRVDARRP